MFRNLAKNFSGISGKVVEAGGFTLSDYFGEGRGVDLAISSGAQDVDLLKAGSASVKFPKTDI